MSYRLPNDTYRIDLIYKNEFNNELISGFHRVSVYIVLKKILNL
jgi:hypothetical protein